MNRQIVVKAELKGDDEEGKGEPATGAKVPSAFIDVSLRLSSLTILTPGSPLDVSLLSSGRWAGIPHQDCRSLFLGGMKALYQTLAAFST
jgi:hypothetical protein